MRRLLRPLWIASVAGLALVAAVAMPRAHACSCASVTPAAARDGSSAVFEGYVASSTLDTQAYERTVVFQVLRAWKGVAADTLVTVETADNSAACGVNVTTGTLMLVYANELEGVLRMSLCSRTTLSELAQEDFAALGSPAQTGVLPPGALTVTGAGGTSGAGGRSGTALVPAGGCAVAGRSSIPAHAALGVGLIVAATLRRRRRVRRY